MILTEVQKKAIEIEFSEWTELQYAGKTKKERQKLAQFFTPPPLTSKVASKQFKKLSRLTIKDLRNGWKFCDPCCGRGFIIFDVVELLVKNIGEEYRQEIMDAMYGMDIEPHFIKLLKALGYKNVKVGDASNPKDWFLDTYNITMKFDCIIMNPPYNRNLHLKILAEAITYLKDDNSKCVNLSPVRWLQDPLAKNKKKSDYHKFENTIRNKLSNIDVINKIDAQNCFNGTVFGADLGIYCCDIKGGFDCDKLINPILIKVINKQKTYIKFDSNKKNGIRVRFPIICNNGGSGSGRKIDMASFGKMLWFKNGLKDGKLWHDCYMHNQYTKTTDVIPYSVKFNSELEAQNFCNQFNTSFVKVYTHWMKSDVNVTPEIVLWVNDCINPRTKLKGYESEWTDDDFYKFFNITKEEQKIIEDTMAKYK